MSDNPIRQFVQVRGNMMGAVAASRVVVIDPAHYAVCLARRGPHGVVAVVARGTGLVAAKIRELAAEHAVAVLGVPVLGRALYHYADADGAIPAELHAAVVCAVEWAEHARAANSETSLDAQSRCAAAVPAHLDPLAPKP